MDSTLPFEKKIALLAEKNGFRKVPDEIIETHLYKCHVQMIEFVWERYNQILKSEDYFNISSKDYPGNPSTAGGHTIAGWACIHDKAYFFNRTRYYSGEDSEELLAYQKYEILKRFGHEAGHVFTPFGVFEKTRQAKNNGDNFNYIERFADDFDREFRAWVCDKKIINESGYKKGSLIFPN